MIHHLDRGREYESKQVVLQKLICKQKLINLRIYSNAVPQETLPSPSSSITFLLKINIYNKQVMTFTTNSFKCKGIREFLSKKKHGGSIRLIRGKGFIESERSDSPPWSSRATKVRIPASLL